MSITSMILNHREYKLSQFLVWKCPYTTLKEKKRAVKSSLTAGEPWHGRMAFTRLYRWWHNLVMQEEYLHPATSGCLRSSNLFSNILKHRFHMSCVT